MGEVVLPLGGHSSVMLVGHVGLNVGWAEPLLASHTDIERILGQIRNSEVG